MGVGFFCPFLVLLASALSSLGPSLGKAGDPDNPSRRLADVVIEADDRHRRAPQKIIHG